MNTLYQMIAEALRDSGVAENGDDVDEWARQIVRHLPATVDVDVRTAIARQAKASGRHFAAADLDLMTQGVGIWLQSQR